MDPSSAPYIVGIGGTQRVGSTSETALRLCLGFAAEAGARVDIIAGPALDLPLYDPMVADRTPAARRLIQALRHADGVVIATPAYHGGVSGMIKNAIDYTEDMAHDAPPYLDGRAVGLIVCANGDQALGTGLIGMRSIVHALRGWPTPYAATLRSNEKPVMDGRPARPEIADGLRLLATQVLQFAMMRRALAAEAEASRPPRPHLVASC
jgi:FMN reductase